MMKTIYAITIAGVLTVTGILIYGNFSTSDSEEGEDSHSEEKAETHSEEGESAEQHSEELP